MSAIVVEHSYKSFTRGKPVLKDISLKIDRGEMVALIGASGSGKSTLIRAIGGLTPINNNRASHSRICISGVPMQENGAVTGNAGKLRAHLGIIFQQFNLVSRLSVLTNVLLGALGRIPRWRGNLGLFSKEEKQKAMQALARVGIEEHALKRGSDLSGGQQQRAAIARTLMQESDILIADEPIASLDPNSARIVMDIIQKLNREDGITVLATLHQVEFAIRYCPRAIALRDGEIVYDGPSQALTCEFLSELYGAESKELFMPGIRATRPETPHSLAGDVVHEVEPVFSSVEQPVEEPFVASSAGGSA